MTRINDVAKRKLSRKLVVPAMQPKSTMPQYWVVGAMWGGREDKYAEFIRGGYWLLGWSDLEQPHQVKRRDRIQPGDHIAIKKNTARLESLKIRAIGTVTGVDPLDGRVHVRWEKTDLNHRVPTRGRTQAINGPIAYDEWTQHVFQLKNPVHLPALDEWPDLDLVLPLAPKVGRVGDYTS